MTRTSADHGLVSYRHPRAGFSLPLPPDWEVLVDPQDKVAAIFVEPDDGEGFRANLVVTIDDLPPDSSLESWQGLNEKANTQMMQDYLLLDTEILDPEGEPVYRRLAHHTTADNEAVTLQQWSTIRGARGYTLTASVATLTMGETAVLFDHIAEQLQVAAGPAAMEDQP